MNTYCLLLVLLLLLYVFQTQDMEKKAFLFLHYCRLFFPLLLPPTIICCSILSPVISLSSIFSLPLQSPFIFLLSSFPYLLFLTPAILLLLRSRDPHYCSLGVRKGCDAAAQCRHWPPPWYSSVGSHPAHISSICRIQVHTSRLTILSSCSFLALSLF